MATNKQEITQVNVREKILERYVEKSSLFFNWQVVLSSTAIGKKLLINTVEEYEGVYLNGKLLDKPFKDYQEAIAEERARVRAIINKLPTVNVKTYEEYGGIEIRGINHAEQLIPKYDLLASLDKPLTKKDI